MTIKTLTTTLLLFTTFLLFTACDSKTHTNTTDVQNSTLQEEISTETDNEGTNSDGDDATTGETTEDGGSNDDNITTSAGSANDDNTTTSTQSSQTTSSQVTLAQADTNGLKSLVLTVDKTTLNKDENTTVKVTATYEDGTSKELTDKVEWVVTPKSSVAVIGKTLTVKKDNKTALKVKLGPVLSNTVNLDITWVVNGHTLPPEPDKALNDSTLLGIDVNVNGVRDDIERKVYATYPKAIQRAVMMQAFRAKQKMLADPDMVGNARVWERKITQPINCKRYLYLFKGQQRIKKMATVSNNWQFNNKARVKLYINYNKALSGGVYSLGKPKLDDCEFNIDKVLKMDK